MARGTWRLCSRNQRTSLGLRRLRLRRIKLVRAVLPDCRAQKPEMIGAVLNRRTQPVIPTALRNRLPQEKHDRKKLLEGKRVFEQNFSTPARFNVNNLLAASPVSPHSPPSDQSTG
jgi:hypothetical protein